MSWLFINGMFCAFILVAGNCRKNDGFYGYTQFDGPSQDRPMPPTNISATCIAKGREKWEVDIQWQVENNSTTRTVGYVIVWSELNMLGGVIHPPCRQISKKKRQARLRIRQPLGGYQFQVYGINKDKHRSVDFGAVTVIPEVCHKEIVNNTLTTEASESEHCTALGRLIGVATADSLFVAFHVHLSKRIDVLSLTVNFQPLLNQGQCNWLHTSGSFKHLRPGDHSLNVSLNDCVSCSHDKPCAVTWGTQIKLEVSIRYHTENVSVCNGQVFLTLPRDPAVASSRAANASNSIQDQTVSNTIKAY